MISIMIKSAIVLAIAACIASALKRQSAALRHAIWTAGLIGALVVPLCSITLPAWQNGIVGKFESLFSAKSTDPQSAPSVSKVSGNAVSGAAAPAPTLTETGEAPVGAGVHTTPQWSLLKIGIGVWIAGAAIGLLLMLLGATRLAWVAVRSEPVNDPRLTSLAEDIRRSLGLRRPVRLLQSKSGHFLGTWGILVPRVLLPSNAVEWSDDRAWMVLGHELAHIKRHDWVVQVFAEAARAIYWFNPVFWLAYSRLRRESEHACDDTVVRMGAAGTRYAEELLELARILRSEESHSHSPILAMAQPSHLERRLVALLNPALNRLAATPWSMIVVALVAIGLTLPLAAVRAPEKPEKTETGTATPAIAVVPTSVPSTPSIPSNATTDAPPEPVAAIALLSDTRKVEPKPAALPRVEVPDAISRPIEVQPDIPLPASTVNAAPTLIVKATAPNVVEPRTVAPPFECRVTPSAQEIRTKMEKTAPLGAGPWHINADRTIWTWDQPFIAGTQVNTMWMRPANADLVIAGRRLDGDAAPLESRLAKDGTASYIAATLTFPKAGCWEVTATAGSSTLTFITKVESQ